MDAVPDQGYSVCWDTINNNDCDTMWWPNGAGTSKLLEDLAPGTYYWQVKTDSGVFANSGTWWSFTVGPPIVSFTKLTPGAGGISTTNATNFTWQAAAGAQMYEFCIDAINNNICDTTWQLNGPTSRVQGGLADERCRGICTPRAPVPANTAE